jgi:hypothetical protein
VNYALRAAHEAVHGVKCPAGISAAFPNLVRRSQRQEHVRINACNIRVVTLGDLKQPRATPFYEHPPSSTPVLDFAACSWKSQINCYDYLRGPKEIDEKLMCSETPTARTLPAIYASAAWSCDLNVEELKVKSNPMGPNYMS